MAKEAQARIKINKRLEESGWRFEASQGGSANIRLEAGVKFSELGDDFENAETHDKRRGAEPPPIHGKSPKIGLKIADFVKSGLF